MYNITPERFETELRKIARAIYGWDRHVSDKLHLLANALHEPTAPCECQICEDRRRFATPITPRYYTPEEAARVYRNRRQD